MRIIPQETLVLSGDSLITKVDALWVGVIRELSQYELNRDEMLHRFDVMVRYADGSRQQLTCDLGSSNFTREQMVEIAPKLLRNRAEKDGGIPIRGALPLPPGMHRAHFL
jgi:hypothetical protein